MFGMLWNWFRGLFFSSLPVSASKDAVQQRQILETTMQVAWRYYYGNMPSPLRTKVGQPDDNVLLNFGRIVVEKGISFLFGEDTSFTVNGPAPDTAQERLMKCWSWNRGQTFLHGVALNGAVTGEAFVKIVLEEGQPFPRLVNLDPSLVYPECDPHDYERILRYVIVWDTDAEAEKKRLRQRQLIEPNGVGWVILDQATQDGGKTWQTTNEVQWSYPFPPLFHCQNMPAPNQFWGIPDLSPDILKLLNSRNFVASNMARVLRYHAHPKTFATGMGQGAKLEMGVDDILHLPATGKIESLEMKGDLGSSLSFLMYLDDNLQSLACVPPIALGKMDGSGPVSGVALRIKYQPLIQRTMMKRRLYGEMLNEINRALLVLMGFAEEMECDVVWPTLLPVDQKEQAEVGILLNELGVSRETLLTDMGYDASAEAERRTEEQKQAFQNAQTAFDRGNLPGSDPYAGGSGA